ncbi:Serine/threonine-protein kinase 19 [Linum grandiflorum]
MENGSESAGCRKRRRKEANEAEEKTDTETSVPVDEVPSFEDSLMFSDTSVALRIMRAQFPRIDKVSTEPFVLRSQLYSSVEDRTQVDRELETLKRENVLRIFKLNTGQDDHAVMLLEDYLKQVERATKRLEETGKGDTEVFEWFRTHVIDCKLEPSIDHQELVSALNILKLVLIVFICARLFNWCQMLIRISTWKFISLTTVVLDFSKGKSYFFLWSLLSNGGKVKDAHISLLINAGFLTRQLIDPNRYWFTIPSIGVILKGISQGRKELLSLLNRRRYKEMMLALLEKKRLRMSPLDIRFHLRDLIGSGHLKTVSTPSGLVVRVSKD